MDNELKRLYAISDSARSKGLDPALKTECIVAQDIADLVEGLVGPKDVAVSIRELSTKMPREEVAFKVATNSSGQIRQDGTRTRAIG